MNSLKEIAGFLRKAKKAIVCGHAMPDGDSIGSVLAMCQLLSEIGVECCAVTPDHVPEMYRFLSGADQVRKFGDISDGFDVAVFLDCTDMGRVGEEAAGLLGRIPNIVNIDHHISNGLFGNYNYVDSNAAATGEIVFELAEIMGLVPGKDMASALYTAITMDTGGFRFANTTAQTHNIVSRLIHAGIDVGDINQNLFENKKMANLKLLGYALTKLQTAAEGQVAWITVPLQVMADFGALPEHADGIINYPRMLSGVEIGLVFREITPDHFKVGFRSKNKVDVNKLAGHFGGGGHPRAAGCTIEGKRAEVEQKIIDLCIKYIQQTV